MVCRLITMNLLSVLGFLESYLKMSDKNRGLINALFWVNDFIDEDSGVGKKIKSQYHSMKMIFDNVSFSFLDKKNIDFVRVFNGRVIDRCNECSIKRKFLIYQYANLYAEIINNNINFLYIRYTHFASPQFLIFLRKLKLRGVTVYLEVPTYPYDSEYETLNLIAKNKLFLDKIFRRYFIHYVDRIVTFTSERKIFGVETINISNAVSKELIKKARLGVSRNENNKDHAGEIVFIGVASLEYWHGYDRMILSMRQYLDANKNKCNIHFKIIGDGSHFYFLKKMVDELRLNNNVHFLGFQAGDSLYQHLYTSNIGVDSLGRHRTNIYENNSLKSKEYLAFGLPIIKSHKDESISTDFFFNVSPDENTFNVETIISWYMSLDAKRGEIIDYAEENLTWESQFVFIRNRLMLI